MIIKKQLRYCQISKELCPSGKSFVDIELMKRARDVRMAQLLVQAGFHDFSGKNGRKLLNKVVYASRHDRALIGYYVQQGADPNYCDADDYCYCNTILECLCSLRLDVVMGNDWQLCENHYDDLSIKESGSVGDITDKACELVRHGAQLHVRANCACMLKKYFFGNTCCRVSWRSQEENHWQDAHAKKLLALRTRLMDVWDTAAIPPAKAIKAHVYEALRSTQDQPVCDIIASYVCVQETYLALENTQASFTIENGQKVASHQCSYSDLQAMLSWRK